MSFENNQSQAMDSRLSLNTESSVDDKTILSGQRVEFVPSAQFKKDTAAIQMFIDSLPSQ